MGKIEKNQKGFGVVETLLMLVILGIVGFTGYFVWHAKQNTDKSLIPNNSTTPVIKKTPPKTTTSTTKSSAIFVKEWGIQIPMPSGDSSYTYSVQDSADIWLTNQQLTQALANAAKSAGKACGISGIQVFRTKPNNVTKTDPRKYSSEINGYVYGLTQGSIDGALTPCNGNEELTNTVSQAETQLEGVWDKVAAQTN